MKRLLLLLLTFVCVIASFANESFEYTYKGTTLNYWTNDDGKTCYVSRSSDVSGNVIIPEVVTYNGTEYRVTSIGSSAFHYCENIKSIVIPNSVTAIKDGAFFMCSSLKSVSIGNSVTSIGKDPFYSCPLYKVALPNTLSWEHSGRLKEILVAYDPSSATLTEDGCVYSSDSKSLLFVPSTAESFSIPEGITQIGSNAFTACSLESLTVPSTIEKVEADAFGDFIPDSYNSNFTQLFRPKRVNFTDWQKWYNNAKLGNLASNPYRHNGEAYAGGIKVVSQELTEGIEEIPDYINYGLTYRDEVEIPSTIKRIGAYAFYNNKELYHVSLPEGLEEIGESAFEGCELLENQELPSSLLSIEDNTYKGCTSLTEITLPEHLTNLGNGVFSECSKLEKAVLVAGIDALGNNLFKNCSALNKLYFPLQLKAIGDSTFYECTSLEEVSLPATLESIGKYAFAGHSNSRKGKISKLIIPNKVNSIGDYAFAVQGITNLTIGNGLTTISSYAFAYNPLMNINFSEGLRRIESNAFAGSYSNSNIAKVILPSSLTEIGENAFADRNIMELVIPDKLTSLPSGSCGTPTTLTIGSGVKEIAADAFSFDNLITLRVCATTPPSLSDAFPLTDNRNDAVTVIVNQGRKKYYETNARWKQFDNIIEEESLDVTVYLDGTYSLAEEIRMQSGYMPSRITKLKVVGPLDENDLRVIRENMVSLRHLDLSEVTNLTTIPSYQFARSLLSEITLPAVTEAIGNSAFYDCQLLQMSSLPESLKSIGDRAFKDCINVTFTEIPESVESIGASAFEGCTGLREITIGSKLASIPNDLFFGCKLLERVDLSKSAIESIGRSAFNSCHELDEVLLPETLKSVGDFAFAGTAIRDLSFLPASIESIYGGAFSSNRRLVAANLPAKITSVSYSLFDDCPRLLAVSMPSGITKVGVGLVNGDKKLSNISSAAKEAPAAETGAFDNIRLRYVSLTVPTLSFRSYLSAPQWGKFETILNKLSIPVEIDNGVEVTNVAEDDYQEMLEEDRLEELQEQAQEARGDESAQIIRRRSARRATARANTHRSFAALFNGAQIQPSGEGSGTRIFINPKEGVNITSIKFNSEEMLDRFDGVSLLLPAVTGGKLEIRTDAVDSLIEIGNAACAEASAPIYNMTGTIVGHGRSALNTLAPGIYIFCGQKIVIN